MSPWSIYLRVLAGHQQTWNNNERYNRCPCNTRFEDVWMRGRNILHAIQEHPDNTKHRLSKSLFTVQRRHTDTLCRTGSKKSPRNH